MGQHNDSQNENNALQNHFTGYLLVALRRKKRDYMNKRNHLEKRELLTDFQVNPLPDETAWDMADRTPPFAQVGDLELMRAISHLTERERYILFERVLNECEYAKLAEHLNARRGSISTAYHRIIKKLRKELQGGQK